MMYSAPALTFSSSRRTSFSQVGLAGVGAAADVDAERGADRVAGQVAAVVEVVHDADEADRVDVVDRGRVRVVAELGRVAGDGEDVAQAQRVGAQQVGLDAEQVPVAAGVVEDRVDRRPSLCSSTHSDCALMRAEARGPSATLMASTSFSLQYCARSMMRAGVGALAAGRAPPRPRTSCPACAPSGLFSSRGIGRRRLLARPRGGQRPSPPRAPGCTMRTERTRLRMWAGVVPQQPPTTVDARRR